MNIKSKMIVCMGAVFVMFSISAGITLWRMDNSQIKFEKFLDKDVALLKAQNNLYAQGLQMGQALRNAVLAPTNKTGFANFDKASREFGEMQKLAEDIASFDPAAQKTLQEIGALRQSQQTLQTKILAMATSNQQNAIDLINNEETPVWRNMKSKLLKSLEEREAAIKVIKADTISYTNQSQLLSIILVLIAIVLGAALSIWLIRSITVPLARAVKVAQTVAEGDLTSRIDVHSTDETGQLMQALRDMNESLMRIVGEVRSSTDTIATASAQIASGNQDLSSRTEQQASSLEETASSMEELTSTVRQNGDNANQANHLAISASDIAVKGGAVVSQVVQTMGAINDSSKKIADIISVIDGIAFQTNILALNAAVEAARAGEQGRGFAVVATEVRNLAQRSAAAAREIKVLIDDSVDKVSSGSKLVDQAGATMTEIVGSIQRVADIMGEISSATREQVDGIEQVNQAIMQMDNVTQQNAALVEEAAAAAESLQDQANGLVKVVSVFNTGRGLAINASAKLAQASASPERRPPSRVKTALPLPSPAAHVAPRIPTAQKPLDIKPDQQRVLPKSDDWEEF